MNICQWQRIKRPRQIFLKMSLTRIDSKSSILDRQWQRWAIPGHSDRKFWLRSLAWWSVHMLHFVPPTFKRKLSAATALDFQSLKEREGEDGASKIKKYRQRTALKQFCLLGKIYGFGIRSLRTEKMAFWVAKVCASLWFLIQETVPISCTKNDVRQSTLTRKLLMRFGVSHLTKAWTPIRHRSSCNENPHFASSPTLHDSRLWRTICRHIFGSPVISIVRLSMVHSSRNPVAERSNLQILDTIRRLPGYKQFSQCWQRLLGP